MPHLCFPLDIADPLWANLDLLDPLFYRCLFADLLQIDDGPLDRSSGSTSGLLDIADPLQTLLETRSLNLFCNEFNDQKIGQNYELACSIDLQNIKRAQNRSARSYICIYRPSVDPQTHVKQCGSARSNWPSVDPQDRTGLQYRSARYSTGTHCPTVDL